MSNANWYQPTHLMEQIKTLGIAGNHDSKSKGDCKVNLEILDQGGIDIQINSKVKVFYGKSIENLCRKMLAYFDINHANVLIEDIAALEYVIAARIEAAIKKVLPTEKEYWFDMAGHNQYRTKSDRFRFSRLYLPGNTPYLMLNAGIHQPRGIILDLEDAVAPEKKFEARFLVRNALRSQNFYGVERMVRINQGEMGLVDLKFIVPHNVNLILIPKCEMVDHVKLVDEEIQRIKEIYEIDADIWLMPIIESALGVENAYAIASCSKNVVSMAIGLEDFTADLGVQRTNLGSESLFARSAVVNACHAAKIQPIDSVFSDVSDMLSLAENVKRSKAMGFRGMGCIHPRQIRVIHEHFIPRSDEIIKAMKIVLAFDKAKEQGLGVVALGTKMIDPPVVKRQLKVLELAIELGLINKDWRDSYEC